MSPATPARPRALWLGWLALLLLALGLGGMALAQFFWGGAQERFARLYEVMAQAAFQQETLRQQLREAERLFGEQRAQLQAQEARIREQVNQLAAQERRLTEQAASLLQREARADQALTRLYGQLGRPAQGWRPAEAAHLLELAAQRLTFDQDLATARQALAAAGERLAETGDPRWEPLRARIQQDLAALETARPVDRIGLQVRLGRLLSAIRGLPLAPRTRAPEPGPPPPERDLTTLARDGLEVLVGLVRVRHLDEAEPAIPAWSGAHDLRQQLRLRLEGARLAVQREDAALYDDSLEVALTWLDRGFDGTATPTQGFRAELEALRATRLAPPLPDLHGTLSALRARLAEEAKAP